MKQTVFDWVIYNAWIVTADQDFTVIENGAVAVAGDRLARIWSLDEDRKLPPARHSLDAAGGIVMPGLVNAHTHLPMTLFRGLADDLPLMTWLEEHIFPAEARHINPDSVYWASLLACAELLLSGTTTVGDAYFLARHVAEAVSRAGLRGVLAQGVIDFPAPGVPDPSGNIKHARDFVAWMDRKAGGLIEPSIFCHSPYTCSEQTLQQAKQAAAELGVAFQVHLAETSAEYRQIVDRHGCSPVGFVDRLGLLDGNTILVHCVHVDRDDLALIAGAGARIVHCPESNMKLAAGIAPVTDMLDAGICVGLGTDGSASNNDLDLFGEMGSAARMHKLITGDPTAMDAAKVVKMATIGGARVLGLDRLTGSLEPGKAADLAVVDCRAPSLVPVYHPASTLVYAARGHDVSHVMVGGRWLVEDGRLVGMDLEEVIARVKALVES